MNKANILSGTRGVLDKATAELECEGYPIIEGLEHFFNWKLTVKPTANIPK